jgi:hypothetical protein
MNRFVQLVIEMLGDKEEFMKRVGWKFVFITPKTVSRVRQISISGLGVVLFLLLFLASAAGFSRVIWFSTSYFFAKFGVYDAKRDNESLLMKVKFLHKYADKEMARVNELVNFEDRTRLQYGLTRISSDIRMAGVGGLPTSQDIILAAILDPVLLDAAIIQDNIETLIRRAELQDSTLSKMSSQVSEIHKIWASRPSIWPATGRITSDFGYRRHPILGESIFHEGLDIANQMNTQIYATADGIVKSAGYKNFYGNAVFLKHMDKQTETVYGHMNKIAVKNGQFVKRGEVIGYMGSTGRSTGSHVHYEVRIDDKCVNPSTYILPEDEIVD